MKDLYKTLGVAEDADEAAIKKAYRKLAKEFHPDITGGDKKKTERFKEINEAYDVLGDSKKRKEYDRLKHAPIRPDGMPEGFDAEAFAQTFGRSRARAGGVQFEGDFDIGDIFSSLFGGGGPWCRLRSAARWSCASGARKRHERAARGDLHRGGAGRQAEHSHGQRVDRRGQHSRPASRTAAACASRAKGRPRRRKAEPPAISTWRSRSTPIRICGARVRHRARRAGDVRGGGAGGANRGPDRGRARHRHRPAGTSSGARLRLRGRGVKHPDGTRGDQLCRVEIVAPKIKPDDRKRES